VRPELEHFAMRLFTACLLTILTSAAAGAAAAPPDAAAIAGIKSGRHDCPHCYLAHADLTNQCVKRGNLEGAVFDDAKLTLMCMSFGDFKGASFRGADLSGANLAHAELDGADLSGARLTITSIRAANLSHAKGLTQAQLDQACGDTETRLPPHLHVKICS
jgi:uncharacterized protein YjbI with pentapeptide repeats